MQLEAKLIRLGCAAAPRRANMITTLRSRVLGLCSLQSALQADFVQDASRHRLCHYLQQDDYAFPELK